MAEYGSRGNMVCMVWWGRAIVRNMGGGDEDENSIQFCLFCSELNSKLTVDGRRHAAAARPAVVAVPAPAAPLIGTAGLVAVLVRRGGGDDAGGGDPAGRGADDRPVVVVGVVLEGPVRLAKTTAVVGGDLLCLGRRCRQDHCGEGQRQGQGEPHGLLDSVCGVWRGVLAVVRIHLFVPFAFGLSVPLLRDTDGQRKERCGYSTEGCGHGQFFSDSRTLGEVLPERSLCCFVICPLPVTGPHRFQSRWFGHAASANADVPNFGIRRDVHYRDLYYGNLYGFGATSGKQRKERGRGEKNWSSC